METQAVIDFSGCKVLLIGDVMLDRYVYGTASRLSPEAPVAVLMGERVEQSLGGAGNVLRNLTALGAKVTFISVVGCDKEGHDITALVGEEPCLPYLITAVERKTTVKTRHIAGHQQLTRVDWETSKSINLNNEQQIINEARRNMDCDVVILSDYGKGIFSRDVTQGIIEVAQGKPIVVDPKNPDWSIYSGATVITPNEHEMYEWDISSTFDGKYTLITQGKNGMTLDDGDSEIHIPATAKQVYDVTGAGDTVVAVLALGVAKGMSMLDAAKLANAAAGVVVGKPGTATVSPAELQEAMQAYARQ